MGTQTRPVESLSNTVWQRRSLANVCDNSEKSSLEPQPPKPLCLLTLTTGDVCVPDLDAPQAEPKISGDRPSYYGKEVTETPYRGLE